MLSYQAPVSNSCQQTATDTSQRMLFLRMSLNKMVFCVFGANRRTLLSGTSAQLFLESLVLLFWILGTPGLQSYTLLSAAYVLASTMDCNLPVDGQPSVYKLQTWSA